MQAYLDNSATTRPTDQVIGAMAESMREGFYNPSSPYGPALQAEKEVTACREAVAASLGVSAAEVVFTAGGTEADNLAILGYLASCKKPGKVLYTAVEHPAVAESCKVAERMGHTAKSIPVLTDGTVDLMALRELLDASVLLLCIMQVNNETGAIQPLEEVAALRDKLCPDAILHVDGVQGYLRIPLSIPKLGIQSYALSAHKIHGPKGVGALVFHKDHKVVPRMWGGGQERGIRSGTENTPGIAGLRCAVENYPADAAERMGELKKLLYETITEHIPAARINGPALSSPYSAPHILNLSIPPVRSETMLYALAGQGVYVGMGSACSSRKQKISETLRAMHVPKDAAESAIRFSLSPFTTREEVLYAAGALLEQYQDLSKYCRR